MSKGLTTGEISEGGLMRVHDEVIEKVTAAFKETYSGLKSGLPVDEQASARFDRGMKALVDDLPAALGVTEVNPPVVTVIDVGERRRDAAFGHDRVRFAQKRLAHDADRDSRRGGFNCRSQARAARSYNQHVVFVLLVLGHQMILQSDQMPIEHSRT